MLLVVDLMVTAVMVAVILHAIIVGNNDGGNYKVKDKLVQTIKFYRVITFNPN